MRSHHQSVQDQLDAWAQAYRGSQVCAANAVSRSLPSTASSFNLVCTRYSAHHWTQHDVLGHENSLVDTRLQSTLPPLVIRGIMFKTQLSMQAAI
jgi:hypothetical protein